jgi:hypothetical protein
LTRLPTTSFHSVIASEAASLLPLNGRETSVGRTRRVDVGTDGVRLPGALPKKPAPRGNLGTSHPVVFELIVNHQEKSALLFLRIAEMSRKLNTFFDDFMTILFTR